MPVSGMPPSSVGEVDGKAARIVELADRRTRRAAARDGLHVVGDDDTETAVVAAELVGGPVDPPAGPQDLPTVLSQITTGRVLPEWITCRATRRATARLAAEIVRYHLLRHLTYSPLYLLRVARYAPMGAAKLAGRVWVWATAEASWSLRQDAATRNDPQTWLALERHRQQQSRWRRPIGVVMVFGVSAGAVVLASGLMPWWLRWPVVGAVVAGLARHGRPADAPIIDWVQTGPQFARLTADLVRRALVDIGVAKAPEDVTFPEQIHRDGPGYLARVNLPAGVEATLVLERRGRLSSALRLPVDQVWPAVGRDHAGQLDLWVGYKPASKMGQPRWSLATAARTNIFDPVEFASNARQQSMRITLMERNVLLGGRPGSGKSYGALALAYIAAMDPRVELKIAEFKGTADFGSLAPYCSTYVCGVDETAIAEGADIIAWGLAECERRGKRIRAARERGEAPNGKVTPELASRRGSGLHPVVIIIDEAHEVFGDSEHGKRAGADAERLIKRGRALGIIVILSTQIPDKNSLPPAITRCVSIRWCMAVSDQVPNDMVLGTGAYKRGLTATCYRPGDDAGWGIVTGISADVDGPVRSQFPSDADVGRILATIARIRGHKVVSGDNDEARRDLLADVLSVMPDSGKVQWQTLAKLLADRYPEAYPGWSPDAVSVAVRDRQVPARQVRGPDGSNRQGVVAADIRATIADRVGA